MLRNLPPPHRDILAGLDIGPADVKRVNGDRVCLTALAQRLKVCDAAIKHYTSIEDEGPACDWRGAAGSQHSLLQMLAVCVLRVSAPLKAGKKRDCGLHPASTQLRTSRRTVLLKALHDTARALQ